MITGIGIDAVYIKRMERWHDDKKLLQRFFSPLELEIAVSKGKGACASLAARFAAKEAFGKALGTGLTGIALKDIMVINRKDGCPQMQLTATAQKALENSGANRVFVSLTHERDNAIAMVVLEKV